MLVSRQSRNQKKSINKIVLPGVDLNSRTPKTWSRPSASVSSIIGAMPEEIQVDLALANHTYRFALADLFKKWSRDRQNPDSRRWPSAIATKLQRAFWKSFIGKKK
jgi:hypothetical protein